MNLVQSWMNQKREDGKGGSGERVGRAERWGGGGLRL